MPTGKLRYGQGNGQPRGGTLRICEERQRDNEQDEIKERELRAGEGGEISHDIGRLRSQICPSLVFGTDSNHSQFDRAEAIKSQS